MRGVFFYSLIGSVSSASLIGSSVGKSVVVVFGAVIAICGSWPPPKFLFKALSSFFWVSSIDTPRTIWNSERIRW